MSKKEKEQAPEQEKKKIKFRFPLWAKSLAVLIISVSVVSIVAINFFSSTVRSITRNFYVEQCVRVADSLGLYLDLDNVKAVKNKVDQIYQSIPEEEKVENSDWDSPEWYTYLEHYNEVASLDDEGNLQGMPEFMAEARLNYGVYRQKRSRKNDDPEEYYESRSLRQRVHRRVRQGDEPFRA